jgi:hypothetical protein
MNTTHSYTAGKVSEELYCLTAAAIAKKAIRIAALTGLNEVTVSRTSIHNAVLRVLFSSPCESKYIRIEIKANKNEGFVIINPIYFKNCKVYENV